jgi:hypothetical protein
MNTDQPLPAHGSKDPETGLFCWRYSGTFKWVTMEKYMSLLADREVYARRYAQKKKARKKPTDAAVRNPRNTTVDKGVLNLHRRGKSLYYIATVFNMKVSIIQKIINDSNQSKP